MKLSNAGAERGFSFQTWVSKRRRSTTINSSMDSMIFSHELGKDIDEIPNENCVNAVAQWKSQKITIGTGCKTKLTFHINFLSGNILLHRDVLNKGKNLKKLAGTVF